MRLQDRAVLISAFVLGGCAPILRGEVAAIESQSHSAGRGEFVVQLLPKMKNSGLTFRVQVPEYQVVNDEIIECSVAAPTQGFETGQVALLDKRVVRYRQEDQRMILTMDGSSRSISCLRPDQSIPFEFDLVFEVDERDAGDDLRSLSLVVPAVKGR